MAIANLIVENFKGIGKLQKIAIRPLTIFLGANSSGKSTCIHALTALSQTVKIPNNSKPIVLDDEYAFVHLGRFINVVHSKSYQDLICIGFTFNSPSIDTPLVKGNDLEIACEFRFKTTLRTQETYIEKAEIKAPNIAFSIIRSKDLYSVSNTKNKQVFQLRYFGLNRGSLLGSISKDTFESFITFTELMNSIIGELERSLYLGPFRQQPQRAYQSFSSIPSEVGAMGESTVALLTNEIIQSQKREHINQIATWLKVLKLGNAIDVERLAKSNLFEIKVKTDSTFVIADLGYGMSQVLPVLAQCSYARDSSTLLFEQPEIHLHPLASRGLARVFIDTIRKKKSNIIAESHSEEILQETQTCVREKLILPDEIAVYAVTRQKGESILRRIDINDDGEIFDSWKTGFSQSF